MAATGKGESGEQKGKAIEEHEENKKAFVNWFVDESRKKDNPNPWLLLQYPAFADAFGFLWKQVNAEGSDKKPLENFIKEWQSKMLSSIEALTRLGTKLGLSLAMPTGKPLQIPQKKEDDGSSKAPLSGFVNALEGNIEKVEELLSSRMLTSLDVPGDGECGYHALDPDFKRSQKDKSKNEVEGRGSRNHIADTLIGVVDKEEIRKLIAPEILGYLEATITTDVTCEKTCGTGHVGHTIDACEHLQNQISEKVKKDRSAVLGENIGKMYLELDLARRKAERDLQIAVEALRAAIEKDLTVDEVLSLENGHPEWQEQYKEKLEALKKEQKPEKLGKFLTEIKTKGHEISKDDMLKLLQKHEEWKGLEESKALQAAIETDKEKAWLQPLQSEGIVKQYLTGVIRNGDEQLVCSQNAGSTGVADAFAFALDKNLIIVNENTNKIMRKSDFNKAETIFIFMIPGKGFGSIGHFKKGELKTSSSTK
jgi:hypothetical protein